MSADAKDEHCAGCGIAGVDDIKLKDCSACHLVKYCGVKCQREHWQKHKKECKKRVAELRDELLFKQPESSHLGDCPICCVPLSLENKKMGITACCCKVICRDCATANETREREGRLDHKCPFCRHPTPATNEEAESILMKRVAANDPVAMIKMSILCNNAGDHRGAVGYCTKAAELGDVDAHYHLALMYQLGKGFKKDEKKASYHLECAVIGGHVDARYNLGYIEGENGRLDRAVKHWIIAANMGHVRSLEALKKLYRDGQISKDDFAAALRAHQAAIEAMKSP